jgi:NhaP-type Na+/H+ or K+/H+ antiporter
MTLSPQLQLAGLVAIGVLVQWFSNLVRLPSIVLLLAVGLVLGPISGIIDPNELFGELLGPLVGLSVAMVLFEGGLSLRLSEARKLGAPLWALVFGGLVTSFLITTGLGVFVADLQLPVAAMIGAILVVTGPTVIKPMLRLARLSQRPARLLRWEGIVNDPLGALLAVLVLEVALIGAGEESGPMTSFLVVAGKATGAGLCGGLAGFGLGRALSRGWLAEHLKVPAMVAGVLGAYAISEWMLHESGLLAVTIMGVVLANVEAASLESIRHFKENVATLLVALLFLVISASLSLEDLTAISPGAILLVLAVVFVVRPVSVWLALMGSGIPWREKLLVSWIAPRGIVAAAMAGALAPQLERAGYADARLILPVLFGVIVTTVLLHGLTIRPLARRLDLAGHPGGGLLIVGVSVWSIALARTLRDAGVDVLLTDSDYRATVRARMQGVEAFHGDVLNEDDLDELPSERVSWSLAASPDDHYNALACLSLRNMIGPDHTLQLTPAKDGEAAPHLVGRALWDDRGTFESLSARFWSGRTFRGTQLTETFGPDAFREQHPEAIVLFAVGTKGLVAVSDDDEASAGTRVVFMP